VTSFVLSHLLIPVVTLPDKQQLHASKLTCYTKQKHHLKFLTKTTDHSNTALD